HITDKTIVAANGSLHFQGGRAGTVVDEIKSDHGVGCPRYQDALSVVVRSYAVNFTPQDQNSLGRSPRSLENSYCIGGVVDNAVFYTTILNVSKEDTMSLIICTWILLRTITIHV